MIFSFCSTSFFSPKEFNIANNYFRRALAAELTCGLEWCLNSSAAGGGSLPRNLGNQHGIAAFAQYDAPLHVDVGAPCGRQVLFLADASTERSTPRRPVAGKGRRGEQREEQEQSVHDRNQKLQVQLLLGAPLAKSPLLSIRGIARKIA
jgi:hypothetical protein